MKKQDKEHYFFDCDYPDPKLLSDFNLTWIVNLVFLIFWVKPKTPTIYFSYRVKKNKIIFKMNFYADNFCLIGEVPYEPEEGKKLGPFHTLKPKGLGRFQFNLKNYRQKNNIQDILVFFDEDVTTVFYNNLRHAFTVFGNGSDEEDKEGKVRIKKCYCFPCDEIYWHIFQSLWKTPIGYYHRDEFTSIIRNCDSLEIVDIPPYV